MVVILVSIVLLGVGVLIILVGCALLSGNNSNNSQNSYANNQAKRPINNLNSTSGVIWKNCPNCNHRINEVAKKCPYCNYEYPGYSSTNYSYSSYNKSKYCPECGHRLNGSAINCGFCGYSFSTRTGTDRNKINTKHINKNGLSFDCPEYYDIGRHPSRDEFHKSIVALSKSDRTCELYVMEYKPIHFDNNARRNTPLLKKYLKVQGYTNITENKSLPYCFNARIKSGVGMLNTKILYNFDYPDVIMIVGNTIPGSSYNCVNDMKVINDTVRPR